MAFDMSIWKSEIRRGVVELCLLAAVKDQEGYGYEIIQRVKQQSGIELTESTVYPMLTRLATHGLLSTRQEPSPQGPMRRYFGLTLQGQRKYDAMLEHWREFTASVSRMIAS
jgi:PadR family transcriptional regulator, regulatory protein PadR